MFVMQDLPIFAEIKVCTYKKKKKEVGKLGSDDVTLIPCIALYIILEI